MNLFLLNLNGVEAGPFTEQQLQAMWLTGEITVKTNWKVLPDGEWKNGAELPERMEAGATNQPQVNLKPLIVLHSFTIFVMIVGVVILSLRKDTNSESMQWEYTE